MTPTRQYLLWDEVCASVAGSMRKGEDSAGISMVNRFLKRRPARELRSQALSLRSILKEKLGQLDGAMSDLLKARSLTRAGSFSRYGCELGLGSICESQGRSEEARRWYWRGVVTCHNAREVMSVGAALTALQRLGLKTEFGKKEQLVLRRAIMRSWKEMRVPGRPSFKDLARTCAALNKAASRRTLHKAKQSQR
jgi:hypothetical protein